MCAILTTARAVSRGVLSPLPYSGSPKIRSFCVSANYCIYPSRLSPFFSPFSPSSVFNHRRCPLSILSFWLRNASLPAATGESWPAGSFPSPKNKKNKKKRGKERPKEIEKKREKRESILHISFNFALRAFSLVSATARGKISATREDR